MSSTSTHSIVLQPPPSVANSALSSSPSRRPHNPNQSIQQLRPNKEQAKTVQLQPMQRRTTEPVKACQTRPNCAKVHKCSSKFATARQSSTQQPAVSRPEITTTRRSTCVSPEPTIDHARENAWARRSTPEHDRTVSGEGEVTQTLTPPRGTAEGRVGGASANYRVQLW